VPHWRKPPVIAIWPASLHRAMVSAARDPLLLPTVSSSGGSMLPSDYLEIAAPGANRSDKVIGPDPA
jgi:hypothetical protein